MLSLNKIIFVLSIAVISYVIGNLLPIDIFTPTFSNEFGKSEYYKFLVSLISIGITLLAVLVALFKDDLREIWKRPVVQFDFPGERTIEECENVGDTPRATKYLSKIEVKNTGNLPAINTEIFIEELTFTPHGTSIPQTIEASSVALKWIGAESPTIIIPQGGKKVIAIAEITPPTSTPDPRGTPRNAELSIGGTKHTQGGVWQAKFSLYAQNHKPTSVTVKITWTGVWATRLTEFNNQYQIVKV